MKGTINKPCFENWENMKIGLHSRFCENCDKSVIDFSGMSRQEILQFLLTNYDQKTCGRLYRSQLDFSHSDFLITIKALSKNRENSNLSFYLLAIGTLILSGCSSPETPNYFKELTDTPARSVFQQDTSFVAPKADTVSPPSKMRKHPIVDTFDDLLLGEIAIGPDSSCGHEEPFTLVEKMPEFPGGLDSLFSYLKQNLEYPEWEKSNKIQGTVYAGFVIDKNGKVKDFEILRTVDEARNFDSEVLSVLREMPNWIPGELEGRKVDVKYHLPVKFVL